MSCQAVSNVQTAAADPYIFTEPPSIQNLQFYKLSMLKNQQQNNAVTKSQQAVSKSGPLKIVISNRGKQANGLASKVVKERKKIVSGKSPNTALAIANSSNGSIPLPRNQLTKTKSLPLTMVQANKVPVMVRAKTTDNSTNKPINWTSASSKNDVVTKIKTEKSKSLAVDSFWHAPDSYIFDYGHSLAMDSEEGLNMSAAPFQKNWFSFEFPDVDLDRDQRLEMKRSQLRRKFLQYRDAQQLRSLSGPKRRLFTVRSILERMDKDKNSTNVLRLCSMDNCKNEALILTAYCHQHITQNLDQKLFQSCTARFADLSQCGVPVIDIEHEKSLCKVHNRKLKNYAQSESDYLLQTTALTSPPRKRVVKPSANVTSKMIPKKMITQPSNKLKSVPVQQQIQHQPQLVQYNGTLVQQRQSVISVQQSQSLPPAKTDLPPKFLTNSSSSLSMDSGLAVDSQHGKLTEFDGYGQFDEDEPDEFVDADEEDDSLLANQKNLIYSSTANLNQQPQIRQTYQQTDLLNACEENSSAYESSEDTGVGGLSESELIEEIALVDGRLLEEHELNNVLNVMNDDFSELFSVQHSDQEVFDRVLEAVDEQVKTMEMTEPNFLGDFLTDQMLEEHEISSTHLQSNSTHQHNYHHHPHLNLHHQQQPPPSKMFSV